MTEPTLSSLSFFKKYWSLSVTFTLLVSMIFMVRFGISMMMENRKLFLDAASLRIGQTQQEVTAVMGGPDYISNTEDFICYCYGRKQKNFADILNWFETIQQSPASQTTPRQHLFDWPVTVRFDHQTGRSVRLKKGTLTTH